jgi:hypothetical protein
MNTTFPAKINKHDYDPEEWTAILGTVKLMFAKLMDLGLAHVEKKEFNDAFACTRQMEKIMGPFALELDFPPGFHFLVLIRYWDDVFYNKYPVEVDRFPFTFNGLRPIRDQLYSQLKTKDFSKTPKTLAPLFEIVATESFKNSPNADRDPAISKMRALYAEIAIAIRKKDEISYYQLIRQIVEHQIHTQLFPEGLTLIYAAMGWLPGRFSLN